VWLTDAQAPPGLPFDMEIIGYILIFTVSLFHATAVTLQL
jgi:hypothetical protein